MDGAFTSLDAAFAASTADYSVAQAPQLAGALAAPSAAAIPYDEPFDADDVDVAFMQCAAVPDSRADAFVTVGVWAAARARRSVADAAAPPSVASFLQGPQSLGGLRPPLGRAVAAALTGTAATLPETDAVVQALRQETQLWRLMSTVCDFIDGPASPGARNQRSLHAAAALALDASAHDAEFELACVAASPALALVRALMGWLEAGALDDAQGSLRAPDGGAWSGRGNVESDDGDATARDRDMWPAAKALQLGAQRGKAGAALWGLDPDALWRGSAPTPTGTASSTSASTSGSGLAMWPDGFVVTQAERPEAAAAVLPVVDARHEADLALSMWALLRVGRAPDAAALATRYGQPWRAAILAACAPWQDEEDEDGAEGVSAPVVRRRGTPWLELLRHAQVAAAAAARTATPASPAHTPYPQYESAMLSAMAGDVSGVLRSEGVLCTWDDGVWATLSAGYRAWYLSSITALHALQAASTTRLPLVGAGAATSALSSTPTAGGWWTSGDAAAAVRAPAPPSAAAVARLLDSAWNAGASVIDAASVSSQVPASRSAASRTPVKGLGYPALVRAIVEIAVSASSSSLSGSDGDAHVSTALVALAVALREAAVSAAASDPLYAHALAANSGRRSDGGSGTGLCLTSADVLGVGNDWSTVSAPANASARVAVSTPLPPAAVSAVRVAVHASLFLKGDGVPTQLRRAARAAAAVADAAAAVDDALYLYSRHLSSASAPRLLHVDALLALAPRFTDAGRAARMLATYLLVLPHNAGAPSSSGGVQSLGTDGASLLAGPAVSQFVAAASGERSADGDAEAFPRYEFFRAVAAAAASAASRDATATAAATDESSTTRGGEQARLWAIVDSAVAIATAVATVPFDAAATRDEAEGSTVVDAYADEYGGKVDAVAISSAMARVGVPLPVAGAGGGAPTPVTSGGCIDVFIQSGLTIPHFARIAALELPALAVLTHAAVARAVNGGGDASYLTRLRQASLSLVRAANSTARQLVLEWSTAAEAEAEAASLHRSTARGVTATSSSAGAITALAWLGGGGITSPPPAAALRVSRGDMSVGSATILAAELSGPLLSATAGNPSAGCLTGADNCRAAISIAALVLRDAGDAKATAAMAEWTVWSATAAAAANLRRWRTLVAVDPPQLAAAAAPSLLYDGGSGAGNRSVPAFLTDVERARSAAAARLHADLIAARSDAIIRAADAACGAIWAAIGAGGSGAAWSLRRGDGAASLLQHEDTRHVAHATREAIPAEEVAKLAAARMLVEAATSVPLSTQRWLQHAVVTPGTPQAAAAERFALAATSVHKDFERASTSLHALLMHRHEQGA